MKRHIMNLAEKKETLVHIIQEADDKLTGLMFALAKEYNHTGNQYTAEEIEDFAQIRDQMLREPESTYTPTQVRDLIRNKERNEI